MPDSAREVLQHLVEARAAMGRDGSEGSSAPCEAYEAARAELDALDPGERAKLVEGLTQRRRAVRIEAAKALEYLVLTEARPQLERGLADRVPAVRDACAGALAALSPASVLPTLVERGSAVSTSVLSRCAQAAVAALGAGALEWVVKSGLSPLHGPEAWASLYELTPQETSQALERGLLTGDADWALGVSRHVCAKGGVWARPAFSVLARLSDSDRSVKIAAAEALAVVGDESELDAVLALLSTAGEAWPRDVTLRVAFLIGRRTETPAAERVIAAAGTSASEQRQLMEELTRLAGCGWEAEARGSVQGAVRRALAHDDSVTVTAAVRAAMAWGLDELVDEVVATLPSSAPGGFSAQAAFLRQERVLEALRHSLGHADMHRRRDAAHALGVTGEPRALDWLQPLVHDSAPLVRSAAEQAREAIVRQHTAVLPSARGWGRVGVPGEREAAEQALTRPPTAPAPAARFFPSLEVTSLRGRFTLQAGTSEEDPSRQQWTGWRYRLLDRGAEARVVWERLQAEGEGPPHELVVSDEGWSVLRTHGHTHEVIAVSPAGDDALRVLIHLPGHDLPPGRVWRYGWEVEHRAFHGRPEGLLGAWWRSWPYFVQVDGMAFFVWRTYWGQRLVLDLTHETLLEEDSPARAALARAMDEEEKRSAYRLLLNLSVHLYEVHEFLARHRSRAPHPFQDTLWRVPAAIHLVGLHRFQEALPVLRRWESLDAPFASRASVAMGPGWLVEGQLFRPILHHALRLLGEEPQGYATYHFHSRDKDRFPVPEQVARRRERATELHPGMSAEQVLRLVGSPDHVRQWSRDVGLKSRTTEEWEYDFRVADGWVTLRLTWEEQSTQGQLLSLHEEPASWLGSEQRVLELQGL